MKFNIRTNDRPEVNQDIEVIIPDVIWKQWYKHNMFDNRERDTDECQECGWISPEHLGAIAKYNYMNNLEKEVRRVYESYNVQKRCMENMDNEMHGVL